MIENSVALGDAFRYANLIVGGIALSAAGVVAYTYAKEYRLHLIIARGDQDKWRGLLPRHVVLITLSHIGLILFTMYEVTFPLLGTEFTWRAPLLLVLYGASMWAMFDVRRFQRHRKFGQSYGENVSWFGLWRH